MNNWLERTELLLGEEKLDILRRSRACSWSDWAASVPTPPR